MRAAGPLLLVALLLVVPLASAHADLATAQPAPGGHADEGVTEVVFVFTEDVEREYTTADVFDTVTGESVAVGAVVFDEASHNTIRVPVSPLKSGVYSASWRALSVDTHTTRGAFLFSIGTASLDPSYDAETEIEQDTGAVARDGFARFAFYLGLFLVVGMPLFALAVLREAPPRALFGTAAAFGLVAAAGALVGLLFLQARTGLPFGDVAATGPGRSLAWRGLLVLGAALSAGVALFAPRSWRAASLAALAFGAASIYATSTGSHAAALRESTTLYVAADAVHLVAAAVWIGGIVAFLHVVASREGRSLSTLVFRFTALAIPSVVLLVATGAAASLVHMPCFDEGPSACRAAAAEEPYMRLVALKVALMAPLVLLGAYNAFRVKPRLEAGAYTGARFRRLVQVEAVLLVVIVGAAGVLAASAPPDAEQEREAPTRPTSRIYEVQNFTAKSHVILQVEPAPVTVGLQKLVVIVHPLGATLPNSTVVALKIYPASSPEPEETVNPAKVTPNEWELEGSLFTSAEPWKVTIILQRPDEYVKLTFDVPVTSPTSP